MSTDSRNQTSVVILGATGGIGSALCKILAGRGYDLCLAGRNADRLAELSTRFQCPTYSLTSTSSETILQCVRQAKKAFGRLDGIANYIGSLLLKPAHQTSDQEWEETLAVSERPPVPWPLPGARRQRPGALLGSRPRGRAAAGIGQFRTTFRG